MANTTSDSKKLNIKRAAVVAEQVVIYTIIVLGIGFYLGTQYQAKQTSDTNAKVQAAVKAVTLASPKN